jgi:hypothetical protein
MPGSGRLATGSTGKKQKTKNKRDGREGGREGGGKSLGIL